LFAPRVAEGLARGGYGPGCRFLFGVFNLAGGIALLLPYLAEKITFVLGPIAALVVFYLLAEGEETMTILPALMAFVCLLFGALLRLRHQADVTAWRECSLATPIRRTGVDRERNDPESSIRIGGLTSRW
jgi:hypothetical protein